MSVRFTAELRDGVITLPPGVDLSGLSGGTVTVTVEAAATREVAEKPEAGPPRIVRKPPRPPGTIVCVHSPQLVEGAAAMRARKRRLPAGQDEDQS